MYGRAATMAGASPQIALTPNAPTPARSSGGGGHHTAWALFGLTVLFFVWAMIEHHSTKVREQLKPQAIGINARNLGLITLAVVIGVNVLKIAAAKYRAWGLPGGDTATAIIGNV